MVIKSLLMESFEEQRLSFEPQDLETYGKDWTHFEKPAPSAVFFPKSIEDVQRMVLLANEHQWSLVPSGGRTGLSGGAVAAKGEIIVSFEKMNQILDFNPVEMSVTCQAGVITEQLQEFARENDLFYPVDFAAAGSSQIGGNIATNAGGIKVIRYGLTRDWVLGLKVVTGQGDVMDLNRGLIKNACGADLRHLFIGSEGVYGFIVEATMKLAPPPDPLSVFVLGVENLEHVMDVLFTFQKKLPLTAFEFFCDKALTRVMKHHGLQEPFETKTAYYALLEFENPDDQHLELALELFEHTLEQGWVEDGVLSQSEEQAQALWALRERISETISLEIPYKNDISVRPSQVSACLAEIEGVVKANYPDFEVVWFGHIGDGNLHLNILKPQAMEKDSFFEQCKEVNHLVFKMVQEFGGSISAEHGIGVSKKPFLHYSKSDAEIQIMKSIKRIFDPKGIMNPGKMFDL